MSNWLANGMSEYEVMSLPGHASFDTTHKFYLAARKDLVDRARAANEAAKSDVSGARLARASVFG